MQIGEIMTEIESFHFSSNLDKKYSIFLIYGIAVVLCLLSTSCLKEDTKPIISEDALDFDGESTVLVLSTENARQQLVRQAEQLGLTVEGETILVVTGENDKISVLWGRWENGSYDIQEAQ